MTDERLRELQRRFQETAAPDDERAYLIERLRAGHTLEWPNYFRLLDLDEPAAKAHLRQRVERGELKLEHIEDLYALPDPIDAARSPLETALSVRFEERDSSFYGGIYYVTRHKGQRAVRLQVNQIDPSDPDDLAEPDHPQHRDLLYVVNVDDPDAYRRPLLALDGVVHLSRRP